MSFLCVALTVTVGFNLCNAMIRIRLLRRKICDADLLFLERIPSVREFLIPLHWEASSKKHDTGA